MFKSKFFKTRLATILITAIVCMALFSGVALAAGVHNKPINANLTIIVDTPGLEVYSDAACTIPVTSLEFGSGHRNELKTVSVYVKNTGNVPFTAIGVTDDSTDVTVTLNSTGALAVGASRATNVMCSINGDANATTTPFIVTLSGSW